jgi:Domain of unknown function (DUF4136)
MKTMKLVVLFAIVLFIHSCSSVKVVTDYDRQVDFSQFTSFAFYKPGIDKAEISDLDKKRILKAIEEEMLAKGFTKSEEPNLLISIFTKEKERMDTWNSNPGWGWNPWGPQNNISVRTEGILYIDFIDAKKNELIWQGKGTGTMTDENMDEKQKRINKFVKEILAEYPPETAKEKKEKEEYEF